MASTTEAAELVLLVGDWAFDFLERSVTREGLEAEVVSLLR
jgi:hypothetical protein